MRYLITSVAIVASASAIALGQESDTTSAGYEAYIVLRDSMPVLWGPYTDSESLSTLPPGTKVQVFGYVNRFWAISLGARKSGYIVDAGLAEISEYANMLRIGEIPPKSPSQSIDTTTATQTDRSDGHTVPDQTRTVPVEPKITIYLRCGVCDMNYVRREIPYVDYVRDRLDADVHVLVTAQRAGAGREFTLFFIGQGRFAGVEDTLVVVSSFTDTENERRKALTRRIELGLVRYIARTPSVTQMRITLDRSEPIDQSGRDEDKWDYWNFRIGLNGYADAEESVNAFRISGRLNADRITEEWKIRLSANGSYRERNFDLGDGETAESVIRNGSVGGMAVNSLGPKWSLGGFGQLTTSSFRNTDLRASIAPALEYNFFPYSESSRRAFVVSYLLSLEALNYDKVTVFDKTEQVVLEQKLDATIEFDETWGSASGSLSFSNYITDFTQSLWDLYRFGFYGIIEVRIVRGLSFTVSSSVSRIRDQIFLPKEEASPEDILLGTIQLPTDFSFSASIGLSYRFGSIYNNIVNPRFGI